MNAMTRMSAKGQVVIPSALRRRLGWNAGVELDVIDAGDDTLTFRRRQQARETITHAEFLAALSALPRYDGPYVTDGMIAQAIDEGMRERWERKLKA